MFDRLFKSINNKEAFSWSLYDFANSSYTIIIATFVFPIFFKEIIAGGTTGDFWWGFAVSMSILLGAIFSPIIGARADQKKRRKITFALFAIISIIGTSLLYFTGTGLFLFAIIIFIITNACFVVAQTIYDSFLINVSKEKTRGKVSGFAWGLGYVGGIVALFLLKPFYEGGFAGVLESTYKLSFPLTALFFLLFATPSFLYLKERKESEVKSQTGGFKEVLTTLKNIKKHKKVAWYILGNFFLFDAIVTIFAFLPLYARTTFSMSISEIMILVVVVQLVAFPATFFLGWLSDKKGQKKILLTTILVWAIIIFSMALVKNTSFFFILAIMGGLVVGSSQAISRSWFSKIIPEEKRAEFFGFSGFSHKIAATTGPLIFGSISSLTGDQRIAMLALIPYFLFAFIIFYKIKED